MEASQRFTSKLKTVAGWVLFLGGVLVLNSRLDGLMAHLEALTEQFGAGAIGFLPAFGLASLQATHTFLYERAALFSALGQTLLSCWPAVLLLAGAILMYATPGNLKKAKAEERMSNRGDR